MKLYRETDFQETPIGKVPKEWEVVKLKDTCELIRGIEPGSKTYNKEGKGFKFIRVSDISKQILETVFVDEKPENLVFCHKENVLLALDGVPGIVAKGMEGAISSGIRIVKPVNKIDNDFLFYILQHSIVQKVIMNYTTGTTIKHASRALDFITLPLPPILEQQKIAEILSTVDEAIQKTDEIIVKTGRLKKALMNELLTGRIRVREENGKLTFHTETEFQETEIGKIPKEWEVVKLEQVVEINKESIDPIKEIPNETFIYIDIDSIESSTGKIRNPKRILGRSAPSRARRVIHENDVIMSTVRPYLKAFAIVPKEYNNQICSTGFAVLTCKNLILPYFLLNVLFSDNIIAQCNRMMVGGQYPALNQSQVSRIKIPLPPLQEQQKIAEILSAVDKKLEIERNEKAKLEKIKRGLMDLLPTGKIRIKVN
jgi:type I restriction enzyme S subunit